MEFASRSYTPRCCCPIQYNTEKIPDMSRSVPRSQHAQRLSHANKHFNRPWPSHLISSRLHSNPALTSSHSAR